MQEDVSFSDADNAPAGSEPQKRMGCFKKGLLIVGGVVLFLVVLVWWNMPRATLRYRLTVNVEANGRPVSGSGVWQVEYAHSGCIDVCQITKYLSGQAFPLDLGSGRRLWVILRGKHWPRSPNEQTRFDTTEPEWLAPKAFDRVPRITGSLSIASYIRSLWWLQGSKALTADAIPQLLYLKDESDPKSFEWIDLPAEIGGVRVTFVSASLKLTDDPITKGIRKTFFWLDRKYVFDLAQAPYEGVLVSDLTRGIRYD